MKISAKNPIKELYMLDELSSLVAMRKIWCRSHTKISIFEKEISILCGQQHLDLRIIVTWLAAKLMRSFATWRGERN
jgi:hypothetical protein